MQTVYDSVGTKAELVRRLNDLIDAEAQVGEIAATLASLDDRSRSPACPRASPADSSIAVATSFRRVPRGHRDGTRTRQPRRRRRAPAPGRRRFGCPTALGHPRALRATLDVDQAATTIAALADFRVAILLIDDHRMTLGQLEDWIADTTIRAIFDPCAASPSATGAHPRPARSRTRAASTHAYVGRPMGTPTMSSKRSEAESDGQLLSQ